MLALPPMLEKEAKGAARVPFGSGAPGGRCGGWTARAGKAPGGDQAALASPIATTLGARAWRTAQLSA